MGYFNLADAIGHLSFGIIKKMKNVYDRLEGLATDITKNPDESILVTSDHGMKVHAYLGGKVSDNV